MRQERATFAVLLTPPQRGAVASIAVCGPGAERVIAGGFLPAGKHGDLAKIGRIVFGRWKASGEEIVACRVAEDRWELHCHGGSQAARSILDGLVEAGCQEVDWRDMDLPGEFRTVEYEAALALAAATTQRTAAILLDQHQGAWQREVQALGELLARGDWPALRGRATELLSRWPLGRHLTTPFNVVFCGRPNAGKSSLINVLLGYERAIVHDQPGTTRDVVAAMTAIDGWPVQLSDVAGLRTQQDFASLACDALETAGIDRAKQELATADLVVLVIDGSLWPADAAGDWFLSQQQELLSEFERSRSVPWLSVVNKSDLMAATSFPPAAGQLVSAQTGAGLPQLLSALSRTLVPIVPSLGAAVPFTQRQHGLLEELLATGEKPDVALIAKLLDELAN